MPEKLNIDQSPEINIRKVPSEQTAEEIGREAVGNSVYEVSARKELYPGDELLIGSVEDLKGSDVILEVLDENGEVEGTAQLIVFGKNVLICPVGDFDYDTKSYRASKEGQETPLLPRELAPFRESWPTLIAGQLYIENSNLDSKRVNITVSDKEQKQGKQPDAEFTSKKIESINKYPDSEFAKQLKKFEAVKSVVEVDAGGRMFGISEVVKEPNSQRMYAVGYTVKDGQQVPRLFYKSNSGGDWRVAFGIENYHLERHDERDIVRGRIRKERYKDDEIVDGEREHYTQETKLHDSLLAQLAQLENNPQEITGTVNYLYYCFADDNKNNPNYATTEIYYDEELSQDLLPFQRVSAGEGSTERQRTKRLVEEFGSIEHYLFSLDDEFMKRPGFLPDFEQAPISVMEQNHPILGEYTVSSFLTMYKGKNLKWNMAADTQGRVWIESVVHADASPSTYGSGDVIIDSGIITSKPVDYEQQTSGFGTRETKMNNTQYTDISKGLDYLLPVRLYRHYQGVERK